MFSAPKEARGREWSWPVVLFVVLLGVHAWLLSVGWTNGNLPGNEFRQSQTALSALFIQRDRDFSLAYPTPVFGAPWSLPMEFPLYQWTVVALSDATGWPLVQSGRAVTAACFYLALAAMFPLLGQLGVTGPRRWVALGLALTCPLYVLYSRAFLIEAMVLALALWFLVAFVRHLRAPGIGWFLVAGALGVAAGLVKVTTLMVFLLPAGWLTLVEMRAAAARGWRAVALVAAQALAVIAAPVMAAVLWTRFADAVKERGFNTQFLRSGSLVNFNFGTVENRFSLETWTSHWTNLSNNLVHPAVLLAAALVAVTVGRRSWKPVALCLGCYLLSLAIFPTLYALHDYYAMTNAVLLLAAAGIALSALLDLRAKWLAPVVLLAVHGTQLWTYRTTYYGMQSNWSPGGSELTTALNRMTNADDAMIITGYDWDSSLPFYAERRALMVRWGMQRDWRYLHAAFKDQVERGVPITVFAERGNFPDRDTMLGLLEHYFDLDPRPLFTWKDVTVYGRKSQRGRMVDAVRRAAGELPTVQLDPSTAVETWTMLGRELEVTEVLTRDLSMLALCEPRPWKFYTQFGLKIADEAGRRVMFAHADSRFWFRVPPGRHVLRAEFCLQRGAFADSLPRQDWSDGVEFYVEREHTDGRRERLKAVVIDPATRPSDAGFHLMEVEVGGAAEENIIVGCGPGPRDNRTRDWAAFASIRLAPRP